MRSSVIPPEIRDDTEQKGKHSKLLEMTFLPPNKTEAQNKTILYKKIKVFILSLCSLTIMVTMKAS